MAYSFDQIFAVDEANSSNVAKNTSVLIFAPGDSTKTPLTITTTDGQPLTNPVEVNSNGFGPAFMHATLDRVAWEGAGYTGFFTSYDGIKDEAVAARSAADAASANAATAATDAAISAQAAIDAANLVGAPADTAVAELVGNPATTTGAYVDAELAKVKRVKPGQDLQAALAAGGRVRLVGTHTITTQLTIPSNTHFDAEPGAVLDISGMPDGVAALTAAGSYGAAVALSVDAAEGASTISVTGASSLTAGDYIKVSSSQVFGSTNQPRGEIVRIASISTNTLTLEDPLQDSYPAASDGKVERATFAENITIDGLNLIGPATIRNVIGMRFDTVRDLTIRNIRSKNVHNAVIHMIDVVMGTVENANLTDCKLAGFGYGIAVLYACQDITISNCKGAKMRHLVTIGGGPGRRGIARRIATTNSTTSQTDASGFDCHPAGEYISFIGCHVIGAGQDGITMQGARFVISGCTIEAPATYGILVSNLTVRGLDGVVSNNVIHGAPTRGISFISQNTAAWQKWSGLSITGNLVTDSGIGITVENSDTTTVLDGLVIANNIVRRCTGSRVAIVRGTQAAVIQGNSFHGPVAGNEVLRLFTATNTLINANHLDSNATAGRGINLIASTGCIITGNQIRNGTTTGVGTDTGSTDGVYMGNRNSHPTKTSITAAGWIITTADASGNYNL